MDEGNRRGGPPRGDRRGPGGRRPVGDGPPTAGGHRGGSERVGPRSGSAGGPYRGPGGGRDGAPGDRSARPAGEGRARAEGKPAGVGSYRGSSERPAGGGSYRGGSERQAGSGSYRGSSERPARSDQRQASGARAPWAGAPARGPERDAERGPPRGQTRDAGRGPPRSGRRPGPAGPPRGPEPEARSYRHPDAESAQRPRIAEPVDTGAVLGPDAEGGNFEWREAQRRHELRIHGRAACLAVAADRFGAIRKLWHTRKRAAELGPLLSRLAAAQIGYREVDDEELTRIAGSEHHEGICLDIVRLPEGTVDDLRERLADETGPVLLLALAGVGNPHNLGAILRSAAHFGALAVLLPGDGSASLSGAVYRTAEGAAERVEIVRYLDPQQLRLRGFTVLATAADGQRALYAQPLPARTLLLLGAEGSGLDAASRAVADEVLAIPGSGRVESLNVAQAATVLAGEWWRAQRAGGSVGTAGDG